MKTVMYSRMKSVLCSMGLVLSIAPLALWAAPEMPTLPATPAAPSMPSMPAKAPSVPSTPAMPVKAPSMPATPAVPSKAMVDINSADATQLESLPGIGPAKAKAIVDYRTQNGPFQSTADLEKVPGIGPKTMQDLAPLISAKPPVGGHLPTVPGVKK